MIKGVYKNIVIIKNPKSDIIEEAIFIVKPSIKHSKNSDILKEAVRLLKNNTEEEKLKKWTTKNKFES
ncbi:MAG: hypothetical protein E7480_06880 [Ruminococcaceae bacterium]|nr:hypothetical protein [Oscillospiraceae bacterium]